MPLQHRYGLLKFTNNVEHFQNRNNMETDSTPAMLACIPVSPIQLKELTFFNGQCTKDTVFQNLSQLIDQLQRKRQQNG